MNPNLHTDLGSTPPDNEDRLSQLVERLLDGELLVEEKAELAQILDSSREAQRRFVELTEFETALVEVHQDSSRKTYPKSKSSREKARQDFKSLLKAKNLPWIFVPICLVVLGLFYQFQWDTPINQAGESLPPHGTVRIVDAANARFSPPLAQDAVNLKPGNYVLEQGVVQLRYSNGADVVIEAPARFDLIDSLNSRLEYGALRAMVPPSAKGFTIHAPSASFEDVGTEFGLRVDRESSVESIFVFDGQVNVRHSQTKRLLLSLLTDDVFQYVNGIPIEIPDLNPETFPSPSTIGRLRWKTQMESRLTDPDLLALFSFRQDPREPGILYNLQKHKGSPVSDARIQGARWVSGRWPGKDALLFDSPEDFAELEVKGEFTEFSIGASVFINRLDNALNAIFNSTGWEKGDLHFQIRRPGEIYIDMFGERAPVSTKVIWEPVRKGQWVYLLATFSKIESVTRVYADGVLIFEAPMDEDEQIRPGICWLGNWLDTSSQEGYAPVRSFQGKIDELILWSRALSEEEARSTVMPR